MNVCLEWHHFITLSLLNMHVPVKICAKFEEILDLREYGWMHMKTLCPMSYKTTLLEKEKKHFENTSDFNVNTVMDSSMF